MNELKPNQIALAGALVALLLFVYFVATAGDGFSDRPTTENPQTAQSSVSGSNQEESASSDTASETLDLSGSCTMNVDVTQTDGDCIGEENDPPYVEQIEIVHMGDAVEVSGIEGATTTWQGSFDGMTLPFSGEKDDGSGITKATFIVHHDSESKTFSGSESWTWSGDSGSCSNGLSEVNANRG